MILTNIAHWIYAFLFPDSGVGLEDYPSPILKKYTTPTTSHSNSDDIRKTVKHFLSQSGIPFSITEYDRDFHNECCDEARRRGYLTENTPGARSLAPFIPGGVVMATTAYTHLNNYSTRIFIAHYTAFLIYLDDVFQHDTELVSEFNERFIQRQPQRDPVLDSFAELLQEFPQHFDRVVSNIMLTSTLNLVTALLLEHETQGMPLSSHARGFPTFSRVMSGASETYALFAFPPEIPFQYYIQALPELMTFINNGNDVLSFYKEDLAGESVNRISNLARCYGAPTMDVLQHLADDAAACHWQLADILALHRVAQNAYINFSHGYIGFHASLARYRLKELMC